MIAWNGKEEIVPFATDLRASEATKVLEVLPLLSEPEVTEGDIKIFRKATTLTDRKLRVAGSFRQRKGEYKWEMRSKS